MCRGAALLFVKVCGCLRPQPPTVCAGACVQDVDQHIASPSPKPSGRQKPSGKRVRTASRPVRKSTGKKPLFAAPVAKVQGMSPKKKVTVVLKASFIQGHPGLAGKAGITAPRRSARLAKRAEGDEKEAEVKESEQAEAEAHAEKVSVDAEACADNVSVDVRGGEEARARGGKHPGEGRGSGRQGQGRGGDAPEIKEEAQGRVSASPLPLKSPEG